MFKFILLLLFSVNAVACHITLRVPTENYPPAFIKTNERWSGHSVEMARVLLANANCKMTILPMPFGRALIALQRGKLDMMMHLSITPERLRDYYFIGPMAHETLLLYTRKVSQLTITSLEDIKRDGLSIGVVRGIYYGADFERLYQTDSDFKQQIVQLSSIEQMLNMVAKGRTDGFLFSSFYGKERQQVHSKLSGITVRPVILWQDPIYFGFSRASISDQQYERFQRAFKQSLTHPVFKYALED